MKSHIVPAFRASTWLFFYALIATGLLIGLLFVLHERTFYFWDYAFYEDQTVLSAQAFHHSLHQGVRLIRDSMHEDYNSLFTIPLVPFVWVFGPLRATFVAAVFVMYFAPFLIFTAALARRIFPEQAERAARVAAACCLATPACWVFILKGYPDIGGAALVVAIFLFYDYSDGAIRWKPMLAAGVLGALAILFRRHYVYAVFAAYAAFGLDFIVRSVGERIRGSSGPKDVARRFLHLTLMGMLTAMLVYGLAPDFVRRAMAGSYREMLASWQESPMVIFKTILGTLGLPALLLGIIGYCMLPWLVGGGRLTARVLLFAATIWTAIWLVSVRQAPYHYPHILPLVTIMGTVALWLAIDKIAPPGLARYAAYSVISVALFSNVLVTAPITKPAMALTRFLPRFTTADPVFPDVNPAYDEIVRLMAYIRSQGHQNDRVVVGASSMVLNYDNLRVAQRTIYGLEDQKLQFTPTQQVDSRNELPLAELMQAQFVITAKPFQYSVRPENQKVVRVLSDALDQSWKLAEDFKLLPERFTLGQPGTEVLIYQRIRPSAPEVIADTAQRMLDYVKGTPASPGAPTQRTMAGIWVEKSSVFPMSISLQLNGTHNIIAHPARAQQQPETVLELFRNSTSDVKVVGDIHFLDRRCLGAEIVTGTDYVAGGKAESVGVFSPLKKDSHFEIVKSNMKGKTLYLTLKSSPNDPQNINYCTVAIGLQVGGL